VSAVQPLRISAHGLALAVPPGWEGRIRRQEVPGGAVARDQAQFRAHAVLHLADFPLPAERGDFGSGAVETMQSDHAFIALIEYHSSSAGTALFGSALGMPRELSTHDFSPRQLQRTIAGQAGTQRFFVEGNRAFCLYVVLGSMADRARAVPKVNAVLPVITIASPLPPQQLEAM
jgi:hypothetical protein